MTGHELTAVIPVHNEAEAVAAVVTSWVEELGRLNIDYVVRVYDDGSRDNTAAKVDDLIRSFPSVQLIHHERRGHVQIPRERRGQEPGGRGPGFHGRHIRQDPWRPGRDARESARPGRPRRHNNNRIR